MKLKFLSLLAGGALAFSATAALADGELNIFNWGNYTNPDLIKKFEEKYKVKVTITDGVVTDAWTEAAMFYGF